MNDCCFNAFAAGGTLALAVFSVFSLILDLKFQSDLLNKLEEDSKESKKAGSFLSQSD